MTELVNSAEIDIPWVLREFHFFDGSYKKDAVNFALEHQEEITPKLLAILEDTLAHPDRYLSPEHGHDEQVHHAEKTQGDNVWSHIYAVTLLSHFKEPRAHALIVKLFSLPDDLPFRLFGDMVTEDLAALFYSTYPGSPELIKTLIENPQADDFARGSAADALSYCVAGGLLGRKEVLDYFSGLFTGREARPTSDFWGCIACVMLDLYPADHMDVIHQGFSQGMIASGMVSPECFERDLKNLSPEICLERIREEMSRRLPEDVHLRLENWACFRENQNPISRDRSFESEYFGGPLIRAAPKIGRNETCPCGSGKKFKKCCLD